MLKSELNPRNLLIMHNSVQKPQASGQEDYRREARKVTSSCVIASLFRVIVKLIRLNKHLDPRFGNEMWMRETLGKFYN